MRLFRRRRDPDDFELTDEALDRVAFEVIWEEKMRAEAESRRSTWRWLGLGALLGTLFW